MCKYCDIESDLCEIFFDPLVNEWYLDFESSEWDEYDGGFVHYSIPVVYCPTCGRKLE